MPASVNIEYRQTFMLGEEHLAKIDEFIRTRTEQIADFTLKYQVYRTDHALITYSTPSEVTSEQNNLAEEIESLRVIGKTPETDNSQFVDIRFSKTKGVDLTVYFDERDRALLLAADLKSYLTSEVLKSRVTKIRNVSNARDFIIIALGLGLALSLLVAWWINPVIPSMDNVHANDSERLKYLVNATMLRARSENVLPIFITPIVFFLLSLTVLPVVRLVSMPSTFYFGKEIRRYDRRISIRNQIFWVIVVGFVVAILASFVYGRLPHS